jgi:metallo-beta-lactamase family protein
VPVRAAVRTLGGLSAHADQAALLAWLRQLRRAPARTFVVHGEAQCAAVFADEIRRSLGWTSVALPARGERFDLD